jgi:capsular polysaccharide transport system permease protein
MTDVAQDEPIVVRQIELRELRTRGHLVRYEDDAPEPEAKSFFRRHILFTATVVIPVFFAAIYLFFIASDRYVSEARFIVRSSSSSPTDGIASLVSSQGLSRANDETFAVNDYIVSRDAADLLIAHNNLNEMMTRPEADIFNRFPNFFTRNSREKLYKHFKNDMVYADIEGSTGISTVQVTAFRPEDAKAVTVALLKYAEDLINRLNERSYRDALKYASVIVDQSRADFLAVETRLSKWRNETGTVDPGKESIAGLESIGKMSIEVSKLEATIAETIALTPNNPNLPSMREKVLSYRRQMDNLKRAVVGDDNSMSNKLQVYEQFVLEREIAGRALASAELNRLKARQEADKQHLYLQTIVEPNLPDQYTYPRRFLYFLGVLGLCGIIYMISRSMSEIAMEHSA